MKMIVQMHYDSIAFYVQMSLFCGAFMNYDKCNMGKSRPAGLRLCICLQNHLFLLRLQNRDDTMNLSRGKRFQRNTFLPRLVSSEGACLPKYKEDFNGKSF
jgi:hypothetical protein